MTTLSRPLAAVPDLPPGLQYMPPRWSLPHTEVAPFDGRTRRLGLLDRPWLGFRGVAVATPLDLPPLEDMRCLLARHLRAHPDGVLARRIDVRRGRWEIVPPDHVAEHVRRLVRLAPAVRPERLAATGTDAVGLMMDDALAAAAHDLPIAFGIGPDHLTTSTSHTVGDMATCTLMMRALITLDADLLAALTPATTLRTHADAVVRGLRERGREWLAHERGSGPATGAGGPLVAAARPAYEELLVPKDGVRGLTRWRNAHAKGASVTAVLTTLAYRALRAEGIAVDPAGFATLFDTRSMLPPTPVPRPGNLAKALWLTADLDDPHAVGAALEPALRTERALPALVAGALGTVRRSPSGTAPAPVGAPLALTMNSAPSMPGIAEFPWREGAPRRFVPMGFSAGPGGITLFAVRQREVMQLVATFDEASADRAAVRRALQRLADPLAT